MEKTCFKCLKVLPIDMFYRHPEMKDGHLNKCKVCNRADTKERADRLHQNPEWHEKERIRHVEKARRMASQYPEKKLAHDAIDSMPKSHDTHLHHWSYNVEHHKDVFHVAAKAHRRIHTLMVYDQERMMYRRLDGVLLATRESAQRYYDYVLTLADGEYPSNPPV